MPLKLEICVDSVESALAAVSGGASRIELCSALSEGGLTPTPGLLKTLKDIEQVKIPIFCMLRPRCGNDFQYTSSEMETILYDLEILKSLGSDGFVFGALDENGNINAKQCRMVIKGSGKLPVTFHRAFDVTCVENMIENCNIIKSLGFKRILTSGFKQSAEMGMPSLKQLIKKCSDRDFIIMPGAGICVENAENILKDTNCKEFHASARTKKANISNRECKVSMGANDRDDEPVFVTDPEIVRNLAAIGNMF